MSKTDSFKTWLKQNTKLGDRAIKDVVSRLKRAKNYVDIGKEKNAKNLISQMDDNPNFRALSITVQSQLRRAIRLYTQYNS